jgi:PBP1b-binding outer membrane lipoprotein LpoB
MRNHALLLSVLAIAVALAGCIGFPSPDPAASNSQPDTEQGTDRAPADVHVSHDFRNGGGEERFEVEPGTVATT